MKQAIKREVEEVENEGLYALLEQQVLIFCVNYFYTGRLVGVNDNFIKLEGASIVYETGAFNKPGYTDAQKLPGDYWYVQLGAIESYGISK